MPWALVSKQQQLKDILRKVHKEGCKHDTGHAFRIPWSPMSENLESSSFVSVVSCQFSPMVQEDKRAYGVEEPRAPCSSGQGGWGSPKAKQ